MEKIVYINEYQVSQINNLLSSSWSVKMIVPVEPRNSTMSRYGAYVVLEKKG